MTDRVIDASVLVFALIGKGPGVASLRDDFSGWICHAPHLIDAELGNVLRRRTRAGDITSTQAQTALAAARDLIDYRYPHVGQLAQTAWSWRDNLSFYDALYVALAARLDVPLMTSDVRLSKVPSLPCIVEVV